MRLPFSHSADDGHPAGEGGQSLATEPGGQAEPAADLQTAPPARPTFTARSGEPAAAALPEPAPAAATVPEPARAPDDAAQTESAEPGENAAPALGPDDAAPAGPGAAPDAGPVPGAGLAPADGDRMRSRPLPTTAGLDEPLLRDATGLRTRWQHVQAGFVDDPQEAVGEAADLIEQTAQALVGALRQRQRQLRVLWEHGPADGSERADGGPGAARAAGVADTEHLRQMMRHYRALFDELCRP